MSKLIKIIIQSKKNEKEILKEVKEFIMDNYQETRKIINDFDDLDIFEYSALSIASIRGFKDIVVELLKIPGINIDLVNKHGETPLLLAISHKYEDITFELIRAGTMYYLCDQRYWYTNLENETIEKIIKILLEKKRNPVKQLNLMKDKVVELLKQIISENQVGIESFVKETIDPLISKVELDPTLSNESTQSLKKLITVINEKIWNNKIRDQNMLDEFSKEWKSSLNDIRTKQLSPKIKAKGQVEGKKSEPQIFNSVEFQQIL